MLEDIGLLMQKAIVVPAVMQGLTDNLNACLGVENLLKDGNNPRKNMSFV